MGWYAFLGFAWVVALLAGVLGAENTPTLGALIAAGYMARRFLDTFWPLTPCEGTLYVRLSEESREAAQAAAAGGTMNPQRQPTAAPARPANYRSARECVAR